MADKPVRWILDDAGKFTAREVRRERRYDAILLDPPKFGRGPGGERWQIEEGLAPLLADCRQLLDGDSRALFLTVYAVRMSALAIGELLAQSFADRSEEHTSELQSLMRISYAVFCLKKKTQQCNDKTITITNSNSRKKYSYNHT